MTFPIDRDPTPGELRIMFETIMASLREVKETMATKEFVNAKFDTYNERISRLESDVKSLELETAKTQTKISRDFNDSLRDYREQSTAEHNEIHARFEEIEVAKLDLDKQKKSRTVALTLALFGATLSLIVSIASAVIINTLIP